MVIACVCGAQHGSSAASPNSLAIAAAVVPFHLSPRETEVAWLLIQGDSNKEIATTLTIDMSTVKTHVSAILLKVKADNRTRAAVRLYSYLGRNI